MQVTVEDLSPVKKRLHVEIPEERVTKELDMAYNQLKKTARVKGFRKGKTPRSVLERVYKKDVDTDVISRLIQETFPKAVTDAKLKPVGTPAISEGQLRAKSPYHYDCTIEIFPEIDTVEFRGIKMKKPDFAVAEEEIDNQLEMLRKRSATAEKITEDRGTKTGDALLVDMEAQKNGELFKPVGRAENHMINLGKNEISETLDQGLLEMKPGETRQIKVSFPQDHANSDFAGQDIDFHVTLKEIRQEVLPEINDIFAKKMGEFENLDQLRDEIRKNLREGYDQRARHMIYEQAFQALLAQTDFALPDTLVEYELDGIVNDAQASFYYHNTSMEELGLTREVMAEKYRPTAEKQARRHLILSKIIEQENLTLTQEEESAEMGRIAEKNQRPLEDIKKFFKENPDRHEAFRQTILEKRAIDLILNEGQIELVPPEEAEKALEQDTDQQTDSENQQPEAARTPEADGAAES